MRTLLVRLLIVSVGACGTSEPETAASAAPLTGGNGLSQNSLTTNGIFQNGIFQNGIFQNGIFQNGIFQNGIFQNGIFQNGIFQNGLWQDAVWQRNPAALEILRTNPYARQVLQYIYGCAMGGDQWATLYPGDPPSPDSPAGDNSPVMLHGQIGLAPQWGDAEGTCDQSCQRWVSACVLARTNAYGVTVDISMRAPDDAPEHIRTALAVTDAERADYPLREGAFYGNLFQTTPQTDGLATSAPAFYACAGPGSNIPDITRRFCSSQGADGPITVVGTCDPRLDFPHGACEGVSGDPETGALHHCFTSTNHALGTEFTEVITVYIKAPLAVCGDAVCDETEVRDASCPSDCHPDGWATTLPFLLNTEANRTETSHTLLGEYFAGISAVDPDDDDVVMVGSSRSAVDLGEDFPVLDPAGNQYGVLVKYTADGRPRWGRRFGPFVPFGAFDDAFRPGGVAVARGGSIIVSGAMWNPTTSRRVVWLAKFSKAGELLWTMTSSGSGSAYANLAPAIDGDGNVFIAGAFTLDAIAFGTETLPFPPSHAAAMDTFVAKISPTGVPLWAIRIGEPAFDSPTALATDLHGDVLLGLSSATIETGLLKLSGTSGNVLWARRGQHLAMTSDEHGDVYATGSLGDPGDSPEISDGALDDRFDVNPYDFPIPAGARPGDFFVVKYCGHDGAFNRLHTVPMSCSSTDRSALCYGRFDGRTIALDDKGSVIVGIIGGNRATINFGAGALETYRTKDVFITAFSRDLAFRWVKHVPMILDGVHRGMAIDRQGRVVMSGTYAGSMLIDDRLLVNNIPEQLSNGNTFLATFATPPLHDVTAPTMSHVPLPMVIEATGPAGAEVFFMPPTAVDTGNAGATVACAPAPSTTFPIGTTQVTCTASDPLGNHSTTTFPVTVVDTLGPTFGSVPSPITVEATGPAGAVASFGTPMAVDLVDGTRPVTCSHASGAVFPLGTTVVHCFASDASGHQTQTAFGVTVVDTTPPAISAPDTIVAIATSASGAIVSYAVTASDLVDGPVAASCDIAPGSVFAPGTTTVTCWATDAHDNTAVRRFLVVVQFSWSNVLPPINAGGTSSFKLGSTIAVKFRLTGASSSIPNAVARLSLVQLSPTSTGAVIEATSTSTHNIANTFRYDASSGQYIFDLSTTPLAVGSWSLRIDLGDGVVRAVTISLHS